MGTTIATVAAQKSNAVLAIFVGGLIAGALDLTAAFISYGPGVPRAITAGLLITATFSLTQRNSIRSTRSARKNFTNPPTAAKLTAASRLHTAITTICGSILAITSAW